MEGDERNLIEPRSEGRKEKEDKGEAEEKGGKGKGSKMREEKLRGAG